MQRYLLGWIFFTLLLSQSWVFAQLVVDDYEDNISPIEPTIGGSYQGPFGGGFAAMSTVQANGSAQSRLFSNYQTNWGIIDIINFSSAQDVSSYDRLEFWFYSASHDTVRTIEVQLRLENTVNPSGLPDPPINNLWEWKTPVKLSEAYNGSSGVWTKAEILLDTNNFQKANAANQDILDFTRIRGVGVLIKNNGATSAAGNVFVDDIRFVEAPVPSNLVDDFDGNEGSPLTGNYVSFGAGVDSGLSNGTTDPARSETQSRYLIQEVGNSSWGVLAQKTFNTVADVSSYGGLSVWFYSETNSSTPKFSVELVTQGGTTYVLKSDLEIPLDSAFNTWTRLFIPLFSSSFQGDPTLDFSQISQIKFIIRANGSTELKKIFIDDIEFVEFSLFSDDFESYSAGAIQGVSWSLFPGSEDTVNGGTTPDNDDSEALYEASNGVNGSQNLLLTQGTLPQTEGFFFAVISREISVNLSGYGIRNLALSGDFRGSITGLAAPGLPTGFDFIFLIQDMNDPDVLSGGNGTRYFRIPTTAAYANFEKNLAEAFIGIPDAYPNGNDLDLNAGTYQIQVLIRRSDSNLKNPDNTDFPLGQEYDLNVFVDNLELKIVDTFNGPASLQIVEVDDSQTAKTSINFDGDLTRGQRYHTENIANNAGQARLIWQAPESNDWYIRVYTDNVNDQTGITRTFQTSNLVSVLPLKYGIIAGAGADLNDPTVGQSTWDDKFVFVLEINVEADPSVFKDVTAIAKGNAISGGDRIFWFATNVSESVYDGTHTGLVTFELVASP